MKAKEMTVNTAYEAITSSTDGTIRPGQLMWLSEDGVLNLPGKNGGGGLLEEEWKQERVSDFEVEIAVDYVVHVLPGIEQLRKK